MGRLSKRFRVHEDFTHSLLERRLAAVEQRQLQVVMTLAPALAPLIRMEARKAVREFTEGEDG